MVPHRTTQGPTNKGRGPLHGSPRPGDKGRGRGPGHGSPRRALQLALLVAVLLVTPGCGLVQPGLSVTGREVHGLFYTILWLALPVFLFVWGMLGIEVTRFRRRRGDESEPAQNRGNNAAIATFFAAPLAIIIVLLSVGEVAVSKVDHIDPRPAERLVVTGSQWQWSARYVKEGLSVSGKTASESSPGKPLTMALPVGRSAQMMLVLKVLPQPQFQAWVRQQQQAQSKAGSCAPTGSSITLTAQHISWDKACIAAVPGQPIRITIINKDAGIAHNFAIWVSSNLKHRLYQTPNVTGPATKTFTAPALKPGKYYFQCDVHGPAMSGALVIGKPGG